MFSELLKLQLLPVTVLQNDGVEKLYQFHHFSPVITHTFHSLYHNDHNILLMTSSNRDRIIAAEIAIFRVMSHNPGSKVISSNAGITMNVCCRFVMDGRQATTIQFEEMYHDQRSWMFVTASALY